MESIYTKLKELCVRRKSHRIFLNTFIEDEIIEKILDIAKTSPYASGKHNWEVTVIKDKEVLKSIADVVRIKTNELSEYIDEEYQDGFVRYASNFTFFENAPAVFFLNFRSQKSVSLMLKRNIEGSDTLIPELKAEINVWERDSFVKSISCAAMLILLATESLGLGGCYMTGPLIAEKEISKLINIKKGRTLGAIIPIGYY